jgi:xyloglucan fucosyltransferase
VKNATRRTPDTTLGGLLPALELYVGDRKCNSRTQEYWLRHASKYQPSVYLIAKLRGYEQRHRKCAEMAKRFRPGAAPEELGDCRFAVWIVNNNGLGNRIISLVSSFVYALVTNRVLLLAPGNQVDKLLCEPFPATSWLLPEHITFDWESITHPNSSGRFGSLVQNGYVTKSEDGHVFANLFHSYNQNDSRFFCEFSQDYLEGTPWLFLMSDLYFAPALHFVPRFHAELDKMFPERETLFHHVSRYLLHPSDSVWDIIMPFYNAYLLNAQRKVGLQVRILNPSNVTIPLETKQVHSFHLCCFFQFLRK